MCTYIYIYTFIHARAHTHAHTHTHTHTCTHTRTYTHIIYAYIELSKYVYKHDDLAIVYTSLKRVRIIIVTYLSKNVRFCFLLIGNSGWKFHMDMVTW